MSSQAWVFMIGFRVFDVGLLIVWLIWFFRLRDSGDEPPEEGGGGGGEGPRPHPRRGPGGGGLRLPTGRVRSGGPRTRDGHRRPRTARPRRDAPPLPNPLPARVRSPGRAPSRVKRRASS
jgi:hypothetical protein